MIKWYILCGIVWLVSISSVVVLSWFFLSGIVKEVVFWISSLIISGGIVIFLHNQYYKKNVERFRNFLNPDAR